MPRPNEDCYIPFELLFKLLIFYYAAVQDRTQQGEYAIDLCWKDITKSITGKRGIKITRRQLEHLVYNYREAVKDKVKPFKIIFTREKNYIKLMQDLRYIFPNLFVEHADGEITFADTGF